MAASDLGIKYQRFLQMLWDSEPRNDEPGHPPIYFLGEEYDSVETHEPSMLGSPNHSASAENLHTEQLTSTTTAVASEFQWPRAFISDFESRLWFTYRNCFPPITRSDKPDAAASLTLAVRLRNIGEPNAFTSDTGWGCMIRSGQCLLGNALVVMILGRCWRSGTRQDEEKNLVVLFADDPRAPFSLHRFVQHGADACGKFPGEWFGPSATAQCIQALVHAHAPTRLRVHVADDSARIYCDEIESLAHKASDDFQPVLVLAGVRLGIDRVTPVYRASLKAVFKLKQFMGIAGLVMSPVVPLGIQIHQLTQLSGRPSASHYFVAAQGDHFFYLDPHQTKAALPYVEDPSEYDEAEVGSLHTRRLRRLHIEKMDPSMLLAFLIRDSSDLANWKESMQMLPDSHILTVLGEERSSGRQEDERGSAIDEVEAFDETEDELETIENTHEFIDTTDLTGLEQDKTMEK